jgi:hypothetical protein
MDGQVPKSQALANAAAASGRWYCAPAAATSGGTSCRK